ncbi:hypothetical protein DFH06DRAFT_1263155, partial [Mycena polygramma]
GLNKKRVSVITISTQVRVQPPALLSRHPRPKFESSVSFPPAHHYLASIWIQDAVNAAILLPTANVYLPILPLSAYDGDMQQPKLHRDSTQTDGDGLFFEFLSYLVSELVPEPDRHVRNTVQTCAMMLNGPQVVRQVLATNETFRYLLFRVGLYKRDPSIDVKLAADVLEIFLGAFDRVTTTTERTAVVQWMRDVVGPLIAVALNARLSL